MNRNRRDLFKWTGLAGLGWSGIGKGSSAAPDFKSPREQRFNMSGYAAPKLETVRIGIIGLGNRGPSHLDTMRHIEGVEFRALCYLLPERATAARKRLDGTRHRPNLYSGGKEESRKLCEQEDVDLVIVSTPYYMHADMAVYAMEQGKHVASEVPAAATIEECWRLVKTAERTRKH